MPTSLNPLKIKETMPKLQKLNQKIQHLKGFMEVVNYDDYRVSVTDHEFITDNLVLILSNNLGEEAKVTLSKEEVHDLTNEFFEIEPYTECPNYWYLKDFASSAFRAKIFKEIKDILTFKVSRMFETIHILEVA